MPIVISIDYIHALHDVSDCNVDIIIRLEDGRAFSATIFTVENIANIMARHAKTGESAGGLYFWTSDMIIVRRLDRVSIEQAVRGIIEDDGYLTPFEEVFSES